MHLVITGFKYEIRFEQNFEVIHSGQFIDVVNDPRIISLSTRGSLKRTLEQIIDQLNRCQKALNQFLEVPTTIRQSFISF